MQRVKPKLRLSQDIPASIPARKHLSFLYTYSLRHISVSFKPRFVSRRLFLKIQKKIWIDLENTPHVLFFNPIIKELKKKYSIIVTSRDYSRVDELADMFGMVHKKIGRHFGKNKVLKLYGLIYRAFQLILFIKKENPILALNHGSRTQLLASKILGIECITCEDYEYGQDIPLMYSSLNIVPQVLFNIYNNRNFKKIAGYPGLKEDVYVEGYLPDKAVKKCLGIKSSYIVITIRPPATEAHYHNKNSEIIFESVVDFLCSKKNTYIILIPRTKRQEASIRKMWANQISRKRIIIPDRAVNGLDLIWYSDLVLSGGGTMIREAAALGVPSYSFFKGQMGAVDKYLSENNKLIILKDTNDIYTKINLARRYRPKLPISNGRAALESIVNTIDSFATTMSMNLN